MKERIISERFVDSSIDTPYSLMLDDTAIADMYLICCGAYSPLTGFLKQTEYSSVLKNMRLLSGVVWSIPIVLPVSMQDISVIPTGAYVKLIHNSIEYGYMLLEEYYQPEKKQEALEVYLTADPAHPGVKKMMCRGDVYAAGPVWMTKRPPFLFPEETFTPNETRAFFQKKGWRTVVGFQTRNPIHRAHEYIQKSAMETVDGLFIQPLVGETKNDDVPASIRMESYRELLKHYFPSERVLLGTFSASMRYAGPKEAVHHALVRKNYGCTHFIVGRDHAGVGNYYGTYDAQKIFSAFTIEELGIVPMFFDHSFYCRKCGQMASIKTCPHSEMDRMILSGTMVRKMLRNGTRPPEEFTRGEVADILIRGLKGSEDIGQ